ncbi:MAG: flagellar assembly peptidoglycan hydrolase FlgJ [Pseudomonadota bacterium]
MLPATGDLSQQLALDAKGLGNLRQAARANAPDALKKAATQFEALFINMMMKSMRDATPQDGMLDNEQSKMFTTMLDQQMSQNLAKRGVGLADVLVRQLSPTMNAQALAIGAEPGSAAAAGAGAPFDAGALLRAPAALRAPSAPSAPSVPALGPRDEARPLGGGAPHIRAFQQKLGADAEAVGRASGIPAKFMLGQAALETGWGRREIRHADGSSSHNLFGIKAGAGWSGKTVNAVTTEYVDGVPQTRVEKFRAYDSYADSMRDYARLLTTNPRYGQVLAKAGDAASFAQGLQKAGYATDPHYATKLGRIIRHTLEG